MVFNPRWGGCRCNLYSSKRGGWGHDIHGSYFPYELNKPFNVTIRVGENKFDVEVNGKLDVEFPNRGFPVEGLTHVSFIQKGVFDLNMLKFSYSIRDD